MARAGSDGGQLLSWELGAGRVNAIRVCWTQGEVGRWPAVLGLGMTREAEELLEAATTPPAAERAALVVRLLDSIAGPDDDVAGSQRTEGHARLDAARGGAIDLLDNDDAMRMIAG